MSAAAARGRLWIGGYGADSGGVARGIARAGIGPDGALGEAVLAGAASSPSFVAEHPFLPVLYAVEETVGTLRAFVITDSGALAPRAGAVSAGLGPCHVAIDPAGRFAVVACYGSGEVVAFALDHETGAIGVRTVAAAATAGHAHFTQFLADGRLLTTDLGLDVARVWRVVRAGDEGVVLELDHEIEFPRGAEPRHVAAGPDGRLYVVGEASVTVFVLAADDAGRYAIVASSPLRAAARVGSTEGPEYGAHLSLSGDGTTLYAPVRGASVIAVLRVGAAGVTPLGEVPCGGDWPRHHALIGDRLYVANQRSNEITVFALDEDGLPGDPVQRCAAASPAVLVPARTGAL